MPTEELYIASVDFPEAKVLADLALIHQDLTTVMEICRRLEKLFDEPDHDSLLIHSLWSAALVTYVRCFASGKRYGLDENLLRDLPGDPTEIHKWYKDIRDKHIAHSVSPYEQVQVGLVLSPPASSDKGIKGVATLSLKYANFNKEGASQLGLLASLVRRKVAETAKDYEAQVLEIGKKMRIEELYSNARPRVVSPSAEVAGKVRT